MIPPNLEWTAIVLAGERPGSTSWARDFGVEFKSHVPVGGIPMLTRVVRTLQSAAEVKRIIILAQDESVMSVLESGSAEFARGHECISRGISDIAGSTAAPWPILVTSADHPLLTTTIVSEFISESDGSDLSFGMVEKAALLRNYPESRRTWFKLRDGSWTGANLWTLRNERVHPALDLWGRVESHRKHPWKVFLLLGPGLFIRALTRRMGMKEGMSLAGLRLGMDAKVVDLPFPEAAIDVDNIADHRLVEAIMSNK